MNEYTLFLTYGKSRLIKGDTLQDALIKDGWSILSLNLIEFELEGDRRNDFDYIGGDWVKKQE